jgi:hypothetical protein
VASYVIIKEPLYLIEFSNNNEELMMIRLIFKNVYLLLKDIKKQKL